MGVDATDEDIVICIEITILGLKFFNHLKRMESKGEREGGREECEKKGRL